MVWKRYYSLSRIEQLKNSGRELLGKRLHVTVKRDGQNIPVFFKEDGSIGIGSHNFDNAEDSIKARVMSCKEWKNIVEMMNELGPDHIAYFEHVLAGMSPTRIERKKKYNYMVLLDIYSLKQKKYLPYNFVFQQGHHYKIPVVDCKEVTEVNTLPELYELRDDWLKWCKKHRREGVVIKSYSDGIWVKEKIDIPKRPKIHNSKYDKPQLPPMPIEKIYSAIEQAFGEVERNGGDIKSPKDTMPIVANHVSAQGREHDWDTPNNMFQYYQDCLRKRNENK